MDADAIEPPIQAPKHTNAREIEHSNRQAQKHMHTAAIGAKAHECGYDRAFQTGAKAHECGCGRTFQTGTKAHAYGCDRRQTKPMRARWNLQTRECIFADLGVLRLRAEPKFKDTDVIQMKILSCTAPYNVNHE